MIHSPNLQGSKVLYVRRTVIETDQKTKYWKYVSTKDKTFYVQKLKARNMYL